MCFLAAKCFFAIYEGSVNRLSVNIPNEVTFHKYSFLKAQSYIEHLLNAYECMWRQWMSIEQPMNIRWVRMNANEWVGTAHEHPLSAHEWLTQVMEDEERVVFLGVIVVIESGEIFYRNKIIATRGRLMEMFHQLNICSTHVRHVTW
jgi:hypothetical protein